MSGKVREDSGGAQRQRQPASPLAAVEALRTAASPATPSREEARVPLHWRLFGGTVLSLVGMLVLTLLQQLYSTLGDQRAELNRLEAAREDLVKREELNAQGLMVGSNFKELQSLSAAVTVLREQIALLERQAKEGEADRRELSRALRRVREQAAPPDVRPR